MMWKSDSEIPLEVKRLFEDALVCRDAGDNDKACKSLSSLISQYPDWSPPYSISGGISLNLRRFQEAEAYFRKAVQLKPTSEIASLGLFHALWEQSKRDEAMAEMKRFALSGGISSDYKVILSEIEAKTGQSVAVGENGGKSQQRE
jgi:predicted Zn-dependent protease